MTKRIRRILIGVLGGVAAAALVYLAAGSAIGLDQMRTDFVALQHLREAMEAAHGRPLDRGRAMRGLTRALELAPRHPAVLAAAPGIYIAVGAYGRAARALAHQSRPDPYLLGMCLLKLGDVQKGAQLLSSNAEFTQRLYERGMVTQRQYAMQMNNAGYLLADAGVRLEEAKAMLEIATRILPLEPNCIDSLGWLHYRLGDIRTAVFYLERAVRQQAPPGEAEIYYHLAVAYARERRLARAEKLLEKTLELDPGHAEAQHELQRLHWRLPGPIMAATSARAAAASG